MRSPVVGRMVVAACTVTAFAALAGAPAAIAHGVRHPPKRRLTSSTSTNWSGYTVDGTNATAVTGSWTVQPATCGRKETSWSSPWVGIDGDISATVEQTGTDTDCSGGTPYYYAWWEMYPKSTVVLDSSMYPLSPGDSMTGSVTYASTGFVLTLTDNTKGWHFSTAQTSTKAPRTSVEWIVEGPSNGTLTDFGTLSFSSDSATINGQSGTLASFGSSTNALTMVTRKGATRAQPGPLDKSGGFADTWSHG